MDIRKGGLRNANKNPLTVLVQGYSGQDLGCNKLRVVTQVERCGDSSLRLVIFYCFADVK